jgi:alpha-galactosidase
MGMKFGLWFEPEMVSPDTELYNMHPDWIVRHPYNRFSVGRSQYVLDFANPEVVDNIYRQMEKVIETAQVDYIKWDMNRNITEAYSPYLNILLIIPKVNFSTDIFKAFTSYTQNY